MENAPTLPEPLSQVLKTYFDVELFWHSFHQGMKDYQKNFPAEAAEFKKQFAEAIAKNTLSPKEYQRLTNHSFKTQQELNSHLRSLWEELYGQEPIPGDE